MKEIHQTFILLLILCIGLLLRIYDLGTESIWVDEGYSIRLSNLNVSQILELTMVEDQHPPLYYIILHYWVTLFGNSEFAIRFLSVIFGFLGIFIIYKIGRLLFDKNVGILSALLLALSVFHIHYSQETRMYSLVALLTLLSFYFFIKILKEKRRTTVIWYILSSASLMYTHVYSLFIIIAQNIFVITIFFLSKERYELNFKRWLLLQSILIILFIPWLKTFVNHVAQVQSVFWISHPSLYSLLETFRAYAGSTKSLLLFLILSLLSLVTYKKIKGNVNWKKLSESIQSYRWEIGLSNISTIYLLGVWLLTPVILPFVISLFMTPIYLTRCTILASLPFYVLVAKGISNIKGKYIKMGVISLLVVLSVNKVAEYYIQINKEQWRDVAHYINTNAKSDDLIVLHDVFSQYAFHYYYKKDNFMTVPSLYEKSIGVINSNAPDIETIADAHRKVWVIFRSKKDQPLIEEEFSKFYNVVCKKQFVGPGLYLFKRGE